MVTCEYGFSIGRFIMDFLGVLYGTNSRYLTPIMWDGQMGD